jgi:hypothetical protein
MLPEPIAVTAKVIDVFEKLGIPYLLGGSFASTIHGIIRTTLDVDLVAEMQLEHISHFISALQSEFYIDENMISDAINRQSSFNIIHQDSMFKVDVFISQQRAFEKSQFGRAQKQYLSIKPEIQAVVSSAEDILLAKLEWYRIGGEVSERQWRDILGILKVQADSLDIGYLRQWANELKVNDLLEQALKASLN